MNPEQASASKLNQADYQALADLRYQIRCFLHFSEGAARTAGLEPQQHQLLLALKGLPSGIRPRIAELAERMQLRHHSVVELTNRLAKGGYVRRVHELKQQGPALIAALKRAMRADATLAH